MVDLYINIAENQKKLLLLSYVQWILSFSTSQGTKKIDRHRERK